MKIIKKAIILLLIGTMTIGTFTDCKEDKEDPVIEFLNYWAIISTAGEYFAQIYRIDPLIRFDVNNVFYANVAKSTGVDSSKIKIILVHGWDFQDKDTVGYPLPSELKDRVVSENWSEFYGTSEFEALVNAGYEIYAFDYLSSNGVDVNGQRFRARLDALFTGMTDKVIIYSHSMGGIVTRTAIYESTTPSYVLRAVSTATPYHGSPWASTAFTESTVALGSIAAFLTDTTGGQDLAWDNYDNSLSGASNTKLTALNAKTDRDSLFVAYYGSITNSSVATETDAGGVLNAACPFLGTTFGTDSDCIVPTLSASLSGHTLNCVKDLGNYDHIDMKLLRSSIRSTWKGDIDLIIAGTALSSCL